MKKLFFALALVLLPASAWAGGCGCGSINAMLNAAKSETIQAVNAYTATEAEAIRSEILMAAQNIIGTIKTESATIVRALVALKEKQCRHAQGTAVAGEAMKNRGYVRQGRAAPPDCAEAVPWARAFSSALRPTGNPCGHALRSNGPCQYSRQKTGGVSPTVCLPMTSLPNRKSGRALSVAKHIDRGTSGAGP